MMLQSSLFLRFRWIIGVMMLAVVAYILVSIIGGPYADALYWVSASGASPNGEYLVVSVTEEPYDMPTTKERYVLDVESGDSWRMPVSSWLWTADSKQILYVEDERHLTIADADGGNRRHLISCEGKCRLITFSPDEERLIFSTKTGRFANALMILDMESRDVKKLTDCEPVCELVMWLPDQNLIAMRTSASNEDHHIFGDSIQVFDPETRLPIDGVASSIQDTPQVLQSLSPTLLNEAVTIHMMDEVNMLLDQRKIPIPYEIKAERLPAFGIGDEDIKIRELGSGKLIRRVDYASIFRVEFAYQVFRLTVDSGLVVAFICAGLGLFFLRPMIRRRTQHRWAFRMLVILTCFTCIAALWVYIEPGFNH